MSQTSTPSSFGLLGSLPQPAERVALLRRAFDATMTDPAFLKDADGLGFEVTPQTGEQVEALVKAAMATPREVADKAERAAASN